MKQLLRLLERFQGRGGPAIRQAGQGDIGAVVELAYQAALEVYPDQVSTATVGRMNRFYSSVIRNQMGSVLLAIPKGKPDADPIGMLTLLPWGENLLDGRPQAQVQGLYVVPAERHDRRNVMQLVKGMVAWLFEHEVSLAIITIDGLDADHVKRMERLFGLEQQGTQYCYTLPVKERGQ